MPRSDDELRRLLTRLRGRGIDVAGGEWDLAEVEAVDRRRGWCGTVTSTH